MDIITDCANDSGQTDTLPQSIGLPTITHDARARLGTELRSLYAVLCDAEPITDTQVELLLRLRHRERDRLRVA
ncbi:MAG: hypothetical protein K2Y56_11085 [Methylobacterium sp.]|uniref:hypothetical protein n=1 Tax=Methylobacterium sp. TaxID=409 RepID=UPI0025CBF212|nr:hypothetical protein [Methylobacterium sp.]MBX9932066.1 hypothetical protein [Methylobacterium sp.]